MKKEIKDSKKINYKKIWLNFKKTWKYVKPYKKQLYIYVLFSIISAGISVIVPLLSAKLLLSLTEGLLSQLVIIAALYFFISIARNVVFDVLYMVSQKAFSYITLSIQLNIVEEIFNLETKEFDNNSSGIFLDRLRSDSSDLVRVFQSLARDLADLFANVGIFIAILIINKFIFLFFLVMFVVIYLIEKNRIIMNDKLQKKYLEIKEKSTGIINELLRGIRDIKVLNAKKNSMKLAQQCSHKSIDEQINMINTTVKYDLLSYTTEYFFNFLFIIVGIIQLKFDTLSLANFVVLYMYKDKVSWLIWNITSIVRTLKEFSLSASRVYELIDNKKYKKEQFGNVHVEKLNGNIEFRNVNFSYNKKNKVLKDMSFEVNANQIIGFVGKSGSGKTTIFSLINKMYDVNNNSIFLDKYDINCLDEKSIRNNISLITQNPYVFNMSIKDNLKLVNQKATQMEIEEACKVACLHDYIMTLPKKYNTIVGEGGVTLSGGQKQRLAIARALIRKTKIILFDEATSALDNETQNLIQKSIENMQGVYTILIVAHRLSTIINCDKIFFLENGEIIDSGTHKELMKKNKEYNSLYEKEN